MIMMSEQVRVTAQARATGKWRGRGGEASELRGCRGQLVVRSTANHVSVKPITI